MEVLKRYWLQIVICLIVAIAVGVAVWFLKPVKVVVQDPSQVQPHKFDSLVYIQKTDSLIKVISGLKEQDEKKRIQYAVLLREQKILADKLQTIPATEVVKRFDEKTGDKSILHRDSTATISLFAMRNAVGLFVAGEQCLDRERLTLDQGEFTRSIIASQDSLLRVKDSRIYSLTREFYDSQLRITGLNVAVENRDRKIRTKNIFIGILSGVTLLGVTGTIIAIVR